MDIVHDGRQWKHNNYLICLLFHVMTKVNKRGVDFFLYKHTV